MRTVSVIVPAYNVEEYLPRCVESILSQTFSDFELILVDDGSSDGTGAVCDGYAARDGRVRVIHRANGGVSSARNEGIEAARGEYVAFADGDDAMEPGMLEYLLGLAREHGADIAACQYDEVDGGGNAVRSMAFSGPPAVFDCEGAVRELLAGTGMGNCVWNKLYRREILPRFLPELRYGEDAVFVYRACAACSRAVAGGKAMYRYYLYRAGGATAAGAFINNTQDIVRVNMVLDEVRRDFPALEKYQSGLCAFMYARRFVYAARAGALDRDTAREAAAGLRAHVKNIGLCPAAGRSMRAFARAASLFPRAAAFALRLFFLRKKKNPMSST